MFDDPAVDRHRVRPGTGQEQVELPARAEAREEEGTLEADRASGYRVDAHLGGDSIRPSAMMHGSVKRTSPGGNMSAQEQGAVNDDLAQAPSWPAGLGAVFERALTCEYASLTRSGSPVTVPSTPYVGDTGTLDVSTGLSYPAKAERARRNPKVALLFADPIGTGTGRSAGGARPGPRGRYATRTCRPTPTATRGFRSPSSPRPSRGSRRRSLRRMNFYYARIWMEITPRPHQLLAGPQRCGPRADWQAPAGRHLPASDPAPSGRQPLGLAETAGRLAADRGAGAARRCRWPTSPRRRRTACPCACR